MKQEKTLAINLTDISKTFDLFDSPREHVFHVVGIGRKKPQRREVLKKLDLKVFSGERVGLIGENGSGKTTLLRTIAGFSRPTSGTVYIDGSARALMSGAYGIDAELTGRQNILNALAYSELDPEDFHGAVQDVVDFVELGEFLEYPLKTYSLGMRARLEFATATAIYPNVLLIDEVLGAGDGYFAQKCLTRMRNLIERTTLVLVSHSLDQIRAYCDRVIWLDDGVIREDGSADEVLNNYKTYMDQSRLESFESAESAQSERLSTYDKGQLRSKIKQIFSIKDSSQLLDYFSFQGSEVNWERVEVGDSLTLEVGLTVDRSVNLTVLGICAESGCIFEFECPNIIQPGCWEGLVTTNRLEAGSGRYLLVPALYDPKDNSKIEIDSHDLELYVLAGNWSQPPSIHLDADWSVGAARNNTPSRLNSWV